MNQPVNQVHSLFQIKVKPDELVKAPEKHTNELKAHCAPVYQGSAGLTSLQHTGHGTMGADSRLLSSLITHYSWRLVQLKHFFMWCAVIPLKVGWCL